MAFFSGSGGKLPLFLIQFLEILGQGSFLPFNPFLSLWFNFSIFLGSKNEGGFTCLVLRAHI